jgi:hypothetical protein
LDPVREKITPIFDDGLETIAVNPISTFQPERAKSWRSQSEARQLAADAVDDEDDVGHGSTKTTDPEMEKKVRRFFISRGRCNDRNFLPFSTIFGEKKLAFFSKTNVMIKILHNLALF